MSGGSSRRFLRQATKIIATIDIIVSVMAFIMLFFLIVLTIAYGERLEGTAQRDQRVYPELAVILSLGAEPFVMIMLIFMVIFICYFYLARYLLYGAKERSYVKVYRWCVITLIIIVIRIAFFITAVYFSPDRMFVSSFGVIGFLYQVFCLWIVRSYYEKLRSRAFKSEQSDYSTNSFMRDTYNVNESHDIQSHVFPTVHNSNGSGNTNNAVIKI